VTKCGLLHRNVTVYQDRNIEVKCLTQAQILILDQYGPFGFNKDILVSPVHITPTNFETKGMDTTPSEITTKSLRQ
jgi:hypothetical protein